MTDAPVHIAGLPMRMTTTEVCAVARFSKRSLHRRIKDGTIDLKPVGRGREKLYLRADVVRALGLSDETRVPMPTSDRPRVSVDAIKAAMAASRQARRRAK